MGKLKKKDKKGHDEIWEWDETPEAAEAISKLHKPEFAGNYKGPLYAPHPELKKPNERL